jgi:hypothetical protein
VGVAAKLKGAWWAGGDADWWRWNGLWTAVSGDGGDEEDDDAALEEVMESTDEHRCRLRLRSTIRSGLAAADQVFKLRSTGSCCTWGQCYDFVNVFAKKWKFVSLGINVQQQSDKYWLLKNM